MDVPPTDLQGKLSRNWKVRELGKYIVTGVEVWPNGSAKVVRDLDVTGPDGKVPKRKEIVEFSRKSREHLAFVSRETIITFHSLMTLSYGKQFPVDGRVMKLHLNRFLGWYRRYVGGEYIWWLEFQKRGAPHVHIASQKEVISDVDRQQFAVAWRRAQGVCYPAIYTDLTTGEGRTISTDVYKVHKHPKQWQVARENDGPKRYILKYALKMRQKVVPESYRNVGRFYGWSRGVKEGVPGPKTVQIYETELRKKLAESGHTVADWPFLPKSLFGIHEKTFTGDI